MKGHVKEHLDKEKLFWYDKILLGRVLGDLLQGKRRVITQAEYSSV